MISTNIRLWNVKVKGVAFADFSTLYDEKLLVSKEDLLTLADQPDRLRARVAKWIGGFAFAALGSPQLKFSDAESSP